MENREMIPVVLAANDYYTPILTTCIKSILLYAGDEFGYDIKVFHTDISTYHQKIISDMANDYQNIIIEFLNVSDYVSDYKLNARAHITTETFYRFLILDIMKDFSKVIYLDSDMIIKEDLAKLYEIELGTNLLAAAKCPDFQGQLNAPGNDQTEYCTKVLKLSNPYNYFQAGVLVMNIEELRNVTSVKELLDLADKDKYRYSDQDILNILCEGKVLYLSQNWNLVFDCNHERIKNVIKWAPEELKDDYMNARNHPYIIHYAGFVKPWNDLEQDFGTQFWEIARQMPFYEELIYRLCNGSGTKKRGDATTRKVNRWKKWKELSYCILPEGSKRRNFIKHRAKKIFKM